MDTDENKQEEKKIEVNPGSISLEKKLEKIDDLEKSILKMSEKINDVASSLEKKTDEKPVVEKTESLSSYYEEKIAELSRLEAERQEAFLNGIEDKERGKEILEYLDQNEKLGKIDEILKGKENIVWTALWCFQNYKDRGIDPFERPIFLRTDEEIEKAKFKHKRLTDLEEVLRPSDICTEI